MMRLMIEEKWGLEEQFVKCVGLIII